MFWYILLLILFIMIMKVILFPSIPEPYRFRNCSGKKWRNEFPNLSKDEIREFLDIFIFAFSFNKRFRLKFEPNDKIMDIYNALYPKSYMDCMELETLVIDLESEYNIELPELFYDSEPTLGEVLKYVIKNRK